MVTKPQQRLQIGIALALTAFVVFSSYTQATIPERSDENTQLVPIGSAAFLAALAAPLTLTPQESEELMSKLAQGFASPEVPSDLRVDARILLGALQNMNTNESAEILNLLLIEFREWWVHLAPADQAVVHSELMRTQEAAALGETTATLKTVAGPPVAKRALEPLSDRLESVLGTPGASPPVDSPQPVLTGLYEEILDELIPLAGNLPDDDDVPITTPAEGDWSISLAAGSGLTTCAATGAASCVASSPPYNSQDESVPEVEELQAAAEELESHLGTDPWLPSGVDETIGLLLRVGHLLQQSDSSLGLPTQAGTIREVNSYTYEGTTSAFNPIEACLAGGAIGGLIGAFAGPKGAVVGFVVGCGIGMILAAAICENTTHHFKVSYGNSFSWRGEDQLTGLFHSTVDADGEMIQQKNIRDCSKPKARLKAYEAASLWHYNRDISASASMEIKALGITLAEIVSTGSSSIGKMDSEGNVKMVFSGPAKVCLLGADENGQITAQTGVCLNEDLFHMSGTFDSESNNGEAFAATAAFGLPQP